MSCVCFVPSACAGVQALIEAGARVNDVVRNEASAGARRTHTCTRARARRVVKLRSCQCFAF